MLVRLRPDLVSTICNHCLCLSKVYDLILTPPVALCGPWKDMYLEMTDLYSFLSATFSVSLETLSML